MLGGLLDNLPGLGGLFGTSAPTTTTSANSVTTTNDPKLVTLDVTPNPGNEGRGKHAAPDTTLAGPLGTLPDAAPQKAQDIADVVSGGPTTHDSTFGEAVKAAAKPDRVPGGTNLVRDSLNFTPPTGKKSGATTSSSSDRPGAAISTAAKDIGDAVKNAVSGLNGGEK